MTMPGHALPSAKLLHLLQQEKRQFIAAQPVPALNKIQLVQSVVARSYGLRRCDLTMHDRSMWKVNPRHVAMYLSRTMFNRSWPEIGRRFGGRDHSTVRHAVRRVERLIGVDKELAGQVAQLRKVLEAA